VHENGGKNGNNRNSNGNGLRTEAIGSMCEHYFVGDAKSHGLIVSTVAGGMSPGYDAIVDSPSKGLLKVQVKGASVIRKEDGKYHIYVYTNNGRYQMGDFDYLAAYVQPLKMWWIIPIAALYERGKLITKILISRTGRSKYSRYKEAWHLLGATDGVEVSDTDTPQILQYTQYNDPKTTLEAYLG
jgi:hypothetical protein